MSRRYRYRNFLSADTMEELNLMIRLLPIFYVVAGNEFFAKGKFYISVEGTQRLDKKAIEKLSKSQMKRGIR